MADKISRFTQLQRDEIKSLWSLDVPQDKIDLFIDRAELFGFDLVNNKREYLSDKEIKRESDIHIKQLEKTKKILSSFNDEYLRKIAFEIEHEMFWDDDYYSTISTLAVGLDSRMVGLSGSDFGEKLTSFIPKLLDLYIDAAEQVGNDANPRQGPRFKDREYFVETLSGSYLRAFGKVPPKGKENIFYEVVRLISKFIGIEIGPGTIKAGLLMAEDDSSPRNNRNYSELKDKRNPFKDK